MWDLRHSCQFGILYEELFIETRFTIASCMPYAGYLNNLGVEPEQQNVKCELPLLVSR